ncbi:SDR family NAD(P)-dependent oxidoreductase [bacterium M00.F.Ca.ET.229.01.1.1]|nr:SDR family NAD(P)-dependent oxidoreductase [bacterium M00.F.Ca.ET.229.01.1.1]
MCRKVALITGSAKGLGKKTALDLAANEIDIVINYRKSKAEAQKLVDEIKQKFGVNVIAIQADVSKIKDVKI